MVNLVFERGVGLVRDPTTRVLGGQDHELLTDPPPPKSTDTGHVDPGAQRPPMVVSCHHRPELRCRGADLNPAVLAVLEQDVLDLRQGVTGGHRVQLIDVGCRIAAVRTRAATARETASLLASEQSYRRAALYHPTSRASLGCRPVSVVRIIC